MSVLMQNQKTKSGTLSVQVNFYTFVKRVYHHFTEAFTINTAHIPNSVKLYIQGSKIYTNINYITIILFSLIRCFIAIKTWNLVV